MVWVLSEQRTLDEACSSSFKLSNLSMCYVPRLRNVLHHFQTRDGLGPNLIGSERVVHQIQQFVLESGVRSTLSSFFAKAAVDVIFFIQFINLAMRSCRNFDLSALLQLSNTPSSHCPFILPCSR